MDWNELSMRERAAYIREGVALGLLNLNDIKHKYDIGGFTFGNSGGFNNAFSRHFGTVLNLPTSKPIVVKDKPKLTTSLRDYSVNFGNSNKGLKELFLGHLERYFQKHPNSEFNTPEWRLFITNLVATESGYSYGSDNNLNADNRIGARGYFLLMPASRRKGNWSSLDELFEDAFNYLLNNLNYLRNNLSDADMKALRNQGIDIYGLMAAAHLGGADGATKWARSRGRHNPSDGNTNLTSYAMTHTLMPHRWLDENGKMQEGFNLWEPTDYYATYTPPQTGVSDEEVLLLVDQALSLLNNNPQYEKIEQPLQNLFAEFAHQQELDRRELLKLAMGILLSLSADNVLSRPMIMPTESALYNDVFGNLFALGGSSLLGDEEVYRYLREKEGFLEHPTDIGDGKITIGSGLTDPKWIKRYHQNGDTWSEEDNKMAVKQEIAKRKKRLSKIVPNWTKLPEASQDALTSYYYNYEFNRENSPKLFEAFDNFDVLEIARQMDATSTNPKFRKGLQKRREEELAWLLSGFNKNRPTSTSALQVRPSKRDSTNGLRRLIESHPIYGSVWSNMSKGDQDRIIDIANKHGIKDLFTLQRTVSPLLNSYMKLARTYDEGGPKKKSRIEDYRTPKDELNWPLILLLNDLDNYHLIPWLNFKEESGGYGDIEVFNPLEDRFDRSEESKDYYGEYNLKNPYAGEISTIFDPSKITSDGLYLDGLHYAANDEDAHWLYDNILLNASDGFLADALYNQLSNELILDMYNNVPETRNDLEYAIHLENPKLELSNEIIDNFNDNNRDIRKLSQLRQLILTSGIDGMLRNEYAPDYMKGIPGGYGPHYNFNENEAKLKLAIDNYRTYLEGYKLPDVVIQRAKGGKIHIKEKNKGKFSAAAKRAGMSTLAYASHVLANKSRYSPTLVKRANFARNASKWKHSYGGPLIYAGHQGYVRI